MEQYSKATSRTEKSAVVTKILESVRSKGDFVRQQPNGTWVAVTERMAREKCGQGLRDFLHNKYRSSTQAKQARRKVDLDEESNKMAELIQANSAIRSIFNELSEDLKKKDACLTDVAVQTLFDTANSRILEELKASRIAYPEEAVSASPPPSTTNLPRLNLVRTVTEEDEDDALPPTSLGDVAFPDQRITSIGSFGLSPTGIVSAF